MNNRPRKIWLSVLLTILSIGLGHIYSGYLNKGVILYICSFIFTIICYQLLSIYPSIFSLLFIIFLGIAYFIYCIFDAVKLTKQRSGYYELQKYNRWYVYFAILIALSFVPQPINGDKIKKEVIQAFKIPASSLSPTLLIGDQIFAKTDLQSRSNVKRGDVIIFPFPEEPSKDFIKRVVGLAGETIEIIDKEIFINGERIIEPYAVHNDTGIIPKKISNRDNLDLIKIPENSVFVMGDNRDNSHDSRFWGTVNVANIKGKAFIIYWSWDKNNNEIRWDRIGKLIK